MTSEDRKTRPTAVWMQALFAVLLAMGYSAQSQASTISDLIVVMESDGKHYTAQHALFTEDELTVVTLPQARQQLHVQFGGPNSNVFARAHEQNPDRLSLWSGTVFSRYRHRFKQESVASDAGESGGTLRATLDGFELTMADTQKLSYSVTWILPESAELIGVTPDAERASSVQGEWNREANLVTYRQFGGSPEEVAIEFQLIETHTLENDFCDGRFTASDECSPDVDQDGIPDYRDVCLPDSQTDASSARELQGASDINPDLSDSDSPALQAQPALNRDALGCANEDRVLLKDIKFESGKTYLSAKVRQVLDRVAIAIQRSDGELYEVASHTDNEGRVEHNQRLSDNRADAIRHYLMLRGVGPNRLRARGYGETSPAHDNAQASGRAANRRVELRRVR